MKIGVGVVCVLVVLGAIGSKSRKKSAESPEPEGVVSAVRAAPRAEPTPTEPDVTVSASEMYEEFKINSVAAAGMFKGAVRVQGVVDSVQTDILGRGAVSLVAGDSPFERVVCYFDKSHLSEIAHLKPRNRVSITGRCKGKLVTQVTVEGCRLDFN